MHLFYTPDIQLTPLPFGEKLREGLSYTLNEEESKHAIRVLRLKTGDLIQLIDGKGSFYTARISDDNPKHCTVNVIEEIKNFGKKDWELHIAIAPTKNMDRMEWFVEKATEIGIDEISLIDCENSERTVVKTERLNKVSISAIKQSLKAYLPTINEVIDYKDFIYKVKDFSGEKFIAHCYKNEAMPHLKKKYTLQKNALILIGPEGDFSEKEIKLAMDNGFQEISLGTSRLRTETAALYACTTINILNND